MLRRLAQCKKPDLLQYNYVIKTIKNTDSICTVNYIFPLYGCKLQTVTVPNQNWCLRIDAVV